MQSSWPHISRPRTPSRIYCRHRNLLALVYGGLSRLRHYSGRRVGSGNSIIASQPLLLPSMKHWLDREFAVEPSQKGCRRYCCSAAGTLTAGLYASNIETGLCPSISEGRYPNIGRAHQRSRETSEVQYSALSNCLPRRRVYFQQGFAPGGRKSFVSAKMKSHTVCSHANELRDDGDAPEYVDGHRCERTAEHRLTYRQN